MTVLAIALPILILVAWTLERRERRAEHDKLIAAHERERHEWQGERRELLNRIKPETAQFPTPSQPETPADVRFDDDEAFWEATMSKEQLAEAVDAMERQMAAGSA